MRGKGRRIVEADVHPRGSPRTAWTGTFAESRLLARQKANFVGLLSHSQKRLF